MILTFRNRLKICYEVLTIRDKQQTFTHEKIQPIFMRGYVAGMNDAKLMKEPND